MTEAAEEVCFWARIWRLKLCADFETIELRTQNSSLRSWVASVWVIMNNNYKLLSCARSFQSYISSQHWHWKVAVIISTLQMRKQGIKYFVQGAIMSKGQRPEAEFKARAVGALVLEPTPPAGQTRNSQTFPVKSGLQREVFMPRCPEKWSLAGEKNGRWTWL